MTIGGVVRVVALLGLVAVALPGPTRAADTKIDRAEVERIVREYIVNNPEIITEALEELQRRQQQQASDQARDVIEKRAKEIYFDPKTPVAGNPEGDLTIVEFVDYRCPVCRRAHPEVTKLVQEDGNIRQVLKLWPILGPESIATARYALAARFQDEKKYLALHNLLMSAKGTIDRARTLRIAGELGLDTSRIKKDAERSEITDQLRKNFELANALGLGGTPTYLFGKMLVSGARPYDALKDLAAQARASKDLR